MISQSVLSYIDKRCKEGKPKHADIHFGGISIILIGDLAELPPVKGSLLWSTGKQLNNSNYIHGYGLQNLLNIVLKLKSNPRLNEDQLIFTGFLNRLRNGKNNDQDCQQIRVKCSFEYKTIEDINSFNDNDAIAIHNTNAKIFEYNKTKLKDLGNPILKILAKHSGKNALNGSSTDTQQLEPVLYVSIEAKIVLLINIFTRHKLINGSTGIIKDFFFEDDIMPPNLPNYIVIDFPAYDGPTFFPNFEERKNWVILRPHAAEWTPNHQESTHRNICSRTQYPIVLAWAWTPWKAQGSTFKCTLSLHLGDAELEHGLTNVTFPRAT